MALASVELSDGQIEMVVLLDHLVLICVTH